jgi:hypothetical protein
MTNPSGCSTKPNTSACRVRATVERKKASDEVQGDQICFFLIDQNVAQLIFCQS